MTETIDHPPKPRLTLRVGITGHRPNKLRNPVTETIASQLARVFAAIEEAGAIIWKANAAIYASESPHFRLLSGFAEGVDQLAISICPKEWSVEAILPFPKEDYLKDFSDSASEGYGDVRN